jgi:hypothetical protein
MRSESWIAGPADRTTIAAARNKAGWHEIDVWRPGDTQPSQTLSARETLDGSPVLPGFTYPVGDLFK